MDHGVAVIGGGPAGLIAAETLAAAGLAVTVYDRMPSLGRKLLMAGRGGLNLTHSEPFDRFVTRYAGAAGQLAPMLREWPPDQLRAWAAELGEPTFIGSSGRVFPASGKASPLLRAWLRRLERAGVQVRTRHRWLGFDEAGALRFETPDGVRAVPADATVLALGGASWPRLGSDGAWSQVLSAVGIPPVPFRPANSGFLVAWSDWFADRFEGQPLKPMAIRFGDREVRGEAMITRRGIEGGAIYALSAALRDAIDATGGAEPRLDLRPNFSTDELERRLATPRGSQSLSTWLRKAGGLSPLAVALLREAGGQALPATPAAWAGRIKSMPLRLTGVSPIDHAISTAGGVAFEQLDAGLMLRQRPGVFVAGEMIDWEAPTGGYLLQASFATGVAAARGALAWLQGGHLLPR